MSNLVITPDQFKAKVRELPSLPAVVMELIASLGNESLSSDDIAVKLSRDPALSAKTLRMANSAFYGMTRQIGSIPEALTILGMRTVRTVVVAAGVTGSLKAPQGIDYEFNGFWRHAVGAALCGQALARELQMDSDIGFAAGLLHDIGRIALACAYPDVYVKVLAHQRDNDLLLIEAERALMNIDHAVAGARIAEHWRFSPVIVEAIEFHHSPSMHHGPGLVGLAHLADAFSHALGFSGASNETVPPTPPDIWAAMFPGEDACMAAFSQVQAQFEDVCQSLQV
ncbi:HDOD domain-containing protein [Aquabacterium sp.]|uniref:HDOD domain-containing protein n=1 Tax=Aquabacterium sp. TaxID=1872578 RepID=UPI002487D832|nr:HDOD domain-containing protein [Aquabacterium sp.]MDI1260012.1 HDOD domain-containing protein [Aquabacterium sp.]